MTSCLCHASCTKTSSFERLGRNMSDSLSLYRSGRNFQLLLEEDFLASHYTFHPDSRHYHQCKTQHGQSTPPGSVSITKIWGLVAPAHWAEMQLQGILTQMTDVKPLLSVATYVDDDTGFEVYQPITGLSAPQGNCLCPLQIQFLEDEADYIIFASCLNAEWLRVASSTGCAPLTATPFLNAGRTFIPITKAPPVISAQGGNQKPLMLQTHGSKFVQFQEVKIQEMASEVIHQLLCSLPRGDAHEPERCHEL